MIRLFYFEKTGRVIFEFSHNDTLPKIDLPYIDVIEKDYVLLKKDPSILILIKDKAITTIENIPYKFSRLKQQLADMDYKTSKYVDGEYAEKEWEDIVAERKAIREKIRALEEQI